MSAPREYRRIINRIRKREAKRGARNGGLGRIDDPWLERLVYNSKRRWKRPVSPAKEGSPQP